MTRAVLMFGPRQLEVREVTVSSPSRGEVRVRVVATGVCHTDLHTSEHLTPGRILPMVMGHEGAGVIEAVGPGVNGLTIGDHVILAAVAQCGTCEFCRRGQHTLCREGSQASSRGIGGAPRVTLDGTPVSQMAQLGTWAETTIVPAGCAIKIDPAMPLPQAALIGCGVVSGFGAVVNVGRSGPGMTIAVLGCGGVGLNGVQGARISGAEQIIAIDVIDAKLQYAMEMGATHIVNASEVDDVVDHVMELTGGRGVDVAADFVGIATSVQQAQGITRRGGTVVLTGLGTSQASFDVTTMVTSAKTITGNCLGMGNFSDEFTKLVALYQDGRLFLDQMISQTIGITDFAEAFRAMHIGGVARTVIQM